jgi:hypothetical protein
MWAEYRLWLGNGTEFSCTPKDFYRYVNALVAARDAGVEINPHLDVQANLCGLLQGVQYDFYLKVEEEDIWYPEFISLAGLEDAARNNWSFETNIRAHTTMKVGLHACSQHDHSTLKTRRKPISTASVAIDSKAVTV